jgi:hypothetical protein
MTDKYNINATVWRIVWEHSGQKYSSGWSIHYDVVRELYENKRTNMPAANVKMQRAEVSEVSNIEEMRFD